MDLYKQIINEKVNLKQSIISILIYSIKHVYRYSYNGKFNLIKLWME